MNAEDVYKKLGELFADGLLEREAKVGLETFGDLPSNVEMGFEEVQNIIVDPDGMLRITAKFN